MDIFCHRKKNQTNLLQCVLCNTVLLVIFISSHFSNAFQHVFICWYWQIKSSTILWTDVECRSSFLFARLHICLYHSLLLICAPLNLIQQWLLKFSILCLAGYVLAMKSKYRFFCDKGKDRNFLQLYNSRFLPPNSGQHCRWAAPAFRKIPKNVLYIFTTSPLRNSITIFSENIALNCKKETVKQWIKLRVSKLSLPYS